ncbi:ABC transporter permease subunit [Dactylosporangium sp. NPDC051541]|uniref:ABC transporter permease subunit n=1 Tax=Dactylosporangium sp. NPDC051541 TaxID=3363977 RepID=UPI00378D70DF
MTVLVLKVLGLGTATGTAVALTPSLLAGRHYGFLAAAWAVIAVLLATYATRRALVAKYLVPGCLLLVLFTVTPVLATLQLSTTNFGDGTRTTKEQTIAQLLGTSVVPAPDSPTFNLTVGKRGDLLTYFLVDRATMAAFTGTEDGLRPLEPRAVTIADGFVTAVPGYTMLTPQQVNEAEPIAVPTQDGAILRRGLREAFEGHTVLRYDAAADAIVNTDTGVRYTVQRQGDREYFVDGAGNRLAEQSWRADVGLDNYRRAFTDERILGGFLRIFAWTVIFAAGSVALTFVVGLAIAVMLNDRRVRGQKVYRSILLLPYAIPGFISILVWSGFFNRDFGLINNLTGLHVNWLGDPLWAKAALLLLNLWLGFPYTFLVATGALQAIPADVREAATIDGAGGFTAFRRITFPLVLVAVAPLLVAGFAFNFNNFNVVELLTGGGPFTPDNPDAGATDILISYTVRLAFGAGGARFGFASAIATLLFVITAVLAAVQFRATRSLEEVY